MQRSIVPLQLDTSAAMKITMGGGMLAERALMARSDVWHKVKVLKGSLYDKEVVLKAILTAAEPTDLVPVKYQVSGEDSFFLARNCAHALDKLCKTNLIIKNPEGDPFILIITLGFASIRDLQINLQRLILTALTKRYDATSKYLNLEEFHRDPELAKTIYSPLSQQKIFAYVLKLSKTAIDTIEHLNLQKNELFNLSAMNASPVCNLKYLDLRQNNLMNMDVLSPFKQEHVYSISRLWLDGNPLCENYCNARKYVASASKYCHSLIQLDGVFIKATSGLPPSYARYFKNESRKDLMVKFVNHYFNLYDSDRMNLNGLYYKNAFYSMSFGIPLSMAQKRNLSQFTTCRNLLKKGDVNKKRFLHLYSGQEDILIGLKKLPKSFHDRKSFVYDLMYDDGDNFAVCVSGVFKSMGTKSQILSFSRTFIIQAFHDHEYKIVNDQYYVDDPPDDIPLESVDPKTMTDEDVAKSTASCFSPTEKEDMLNHFIKVSTVNNEWAQTYLEEAQWNLRKALSGFIQDYKDTAVPANAFLR